jgi:hypothetical protein
MHGQPSDFPNMGRRPMYGETSHIESVSIYGKYLVYMGMPTTTVSTIPPLRCWGCNGGGGRGPLTLSVVVGVLVVVVVVVIGVCEHADTHFK